MRRFFLAAALLLAAAPAASATEITPNTKPELRAVEVAAPAIRKDITVAPAERESRSAKTSRTTQFSTRDLTLIAVVLLVVLIALAV